MVWRSKSRAVAAKIFLFIKRSEKEKKNLRLSTPSGPASPAHKVPTGFSRLPPAGPAIPVVAKP
jgi:hypothetical protein